MLAERLFREDYKGKHSYGSLFFCRPNAESEGREMNVFKIVWRKDHYAVSIPDYPGGDVVPYETAKALADELAAERAKVELLARAITIAAPIFRDCAADHGDKLPHEQDAIRGLFNALEQTKPNEPKRLN